MLNLVLYGAQRRPLFPVETDLTRDNKLANQITQAKWSANDLLDQIVDQSFYSVDVVFV